MIGHPLDTGSLERPARARQYDATVLDAAVPFALCGCGLMLVIAVALYLCGPLWRLRGGRLDEIRPDADGDAEALLLPEALLRLARRSGVVPPPVFLRNPRRLTAGAVTVGSAGRYVIVLDNGLCALHPDRRKTRHIFDAVVLHELAHIRNRDVELGVAVRALWQAFCIVIVLPCGAVLAWLSVGEFTGSMHTHWPGEGPSPLWTAAMLATLVAMTYATYTDFLRSRELCADLDAVDWGADPRAWCDLAMNAMGSGWDKTAWDAGPKGWSDLLAWVRKARPLRAATRPWHTHPGWWRRYRALRRLDHTGGPNGSCTQAVLLMGTIMVLLYMFFSVLVPASRLAPLPSLLFYSGLVLCVSLGHGLTRHPNVQLRPQPRPFGAGAHGGARRTVVHVTCVLLLFLIDPLGLLLRGA
ncbi:MULTISPECIES: M48 family metalloprotease [unclassified Streptomyces]|uniref:M48 family metalloprotease n=1 Tax=unclassified Streptomyces TaxID=2593676 RepID=UPI0023668C19|nr:MULTISPECIES: M48 family metalloprotease [unclassified Streptomyces]MDF3142296.1 M48 family metalloprotease [Streptomyces sp. T21Q-yed]WDF36243.1 M48 family metalloprotease [Streptomyces sp. T12]